MHVITNEQYIVRTGCRTCKVRRVKCDETRPTCLRCARSKYICEGYLFSFSAYCPSPERHESSDEASQKKIKPVDSLCFYRTLKTLAELSEPDYRSYDFCRRYTLHNMATHHFTRFWTHTVISASHAEPAILHAMLALSGVCRVYQEGQSVLPSGDRTTFMIPVWSHYGKALHFLQNRITTASIEDTHIVLIVCLVLLTFDIIEGRYREALVHLNHGRQILKRLHGITSAVDTTMLRLMLPQQASTTLDEISYSFALMDLQSVYFDSELQFKLVDNLDIGSMDPPTIPPFFNSFDDAWRMMLLLDNEACHLAAVVSQTKSEQINENSMLALWQGKLLASLRQWKVAFDSSPLRTIPRGSSPGANGDERSISLRISHLYLTIVVRISLCRHDDMVFDPLLPYFSSLVSLCEDLVPRLPAISLDSRVIEPLYTTGCLCRHPGLRRRALQVLSMAGREGHWDSKLISIVIRERMALEESEANYVYNPNETIPEDVELLSEIIPMHARWSETHAEFLSDDYKRADLQFRRKSRSNHNSSMAGDDCYEVYKTIVALD